MKIFTKTITTLLLTLCFSFLGQAQNSTTLSDRSPGYWVFGINGGLAYQQSDVPTTLEGFGLGLTLGKNFLYNPNGIAFDLRGRLLFARSIGLSYNQSRGILNNEALNGNKGLDYSSAGFVFDNNQTTLGELALEGVINFEGLRRRNNVHLALFGGIGLDYFETKIDQQSGTDLYNYNSIDVNNSNSEIKSDLKNILDGEYETVADGFENDNGKIAFMPSLGVELGYWFTPRFAIDLSHRVTWTNSDLFDGQQWNNNNITTGDNDIYHYTSLGLKWIIDVSKTKGKIPIITILQPDNIPYTTNNPTAIVRATIKNINSPMDVNYRVNGQKIRFDFFNKQLSNVPNLKQGRNEINIRATNSAGSDEETIVIYYEPDEIITTNSVLPNVNITNPRENGETVDEKRFTIEAWITEVPSKRDISLLVNNRSIGDFRFNSSNGKFSSNIRLQEGKNTIKIIAKNSDGEATDEKTIYYETRPQVAYPKVKITRPSADPYQTDNRTITLKARIDNIAEKRNIQVKLNGRNVRYFDFNQRNGEVSADIDLRDGRNTIVVSANNEAGSDDDKVRIDYETYTAPPRVDAPRVRITRPTGNPYRTENRRETVRARVDNVNSKNDIEVAINGRTTNNFSYYRNGEVSFEVNLRDGRNTITVSARNDGGSDRDDIRIDYEAYVAPPRVDAPRVRITSVSQPTSSPFSPNRCNTTVDATIKNINNKNDISFFVNGKRVYDFSFDTRRKTFKASFALAKGRTEIVIEARNDGGKDKDQAYADCQGATQKNNPPKVNITSPAATSTTSKSTCNLKATIENISNQNDIELIVNGAKSGSFKFVSRTKKLEASIFLKKGVNRIIVKAKNKDGRDEDAIEVKYLAGISAPVVTVKKPTVSITSPKNNSTTTKATTSLQAKVQNISRKSDIAITVNGKKISSFNFSPISKTIKASVKLKQGKNSLVVKVTNKTGTAQDAKTINYNLPAPTVKKPTVNITSPKNNTTFTKSRTSLKATVKNALQKDLTLTVNGKEVKNFRLTGTSLTASVLLKKGKNNITLIANNGGGHAKSSVNVNYNIPTPTVAKPKVEFISPSKESSSAKKTNFNIEVMLQNVASSSDITLKLNGKKILKFKYNKNTKFLTANLNLKPGNNTIFVEGRNKSGKATDQVKVNYRATISTPTPSSVTRKPVIKISSVSQPTSSPFSPNVAKSTILAKITGISSKSDIKFIVNGKETTDFTYGKFNNEFKAVINLKKGSNSFVIKATNKGGTAEEKKNLNF